MVGVGIISQGFKVYPCKKKQWKDTSIGPFKNCLKTNLPSVFPQKKKID